MKEFFVLLISLSSLKIVSQVAILNEPFTTANASAQSLPTGWTRDASLDWISDDGSGPVPSCTLSGSSGGTLVVSQNNTSGFLHIQSKLFSSAGYSNITMQWNQYNASSAPSMTIEWSPDGTSWTAVTAFTNSPVTDDWYNATATLQVAAAQSPTLYVRFSYISDGAGINYIGLDDVKVLGDVSPATYYWNGGSIFASPANGGSGNWGTVNGWRIASPIGPQANWLENNYAVFSGAAGVVAITANRTALGYSFNTSSYTIQTTSAAAQTLNGPISLDNNVELVLAPNFPSTNSGIIGIGRVNGIGASSITIIANTTSTAGATKINLANANASISVPTNIITTASGVGLAGYVATANNCAINGNITNNSTLRTIVGATTGVVLNINGVISGSSGLQISDGANNGGGRINFNNNNTYGGSTIFNSAATATIALGANNAFPISTNLTMGATNQFAAQFGGIFDLNGYNQTIGNIGNPTTFSIGSGTITNNSSVSHSTLTITQSTVGSFNRSIRDGSISKVAIVKSGTSTLTLNGAGSVYGFSGGLTISAGELRFNPSSSPVNISSCPVALNGGTLSSVSISISSVLNFSTLNVTDNSSISLSAINAHTLNFAASNALSWTPLKTLTIIGWQGTYSNTVGSSGTVGKIFVGSNASGLTASQLSQIRFYDGVSYYGATVLSNGELVPAGLVTKLETLYCGYTATSNLEFIWADSLNIPTTQFNWRYRFKLFDGTNTIIWTTNNEWPILQFYLVPGYLNNTTYTVSVAWSDNNGTTFSAYGPACSLTSPSTPTTQLSPASCGVTASSYTQLLFANQVGGATQYEYRLINSALSYTQTFVKSNNNFILAQFNNLLNNTTYSVSVRTLVNGIWGNFAISCNVTTPGAPLTQLSAGSCGSSPLSYNTLLFADAVAGATQYQYQLVNTALSYTQTLTKSNNNFILSQFTGLLNNTAYTVSVRPFVNGAFSNFGTGCQVTTPGSPTTQLAIGFCGITASSFTQLINANIVGGATQYQYQLTNTSLGYSQSFAKTNQNFILSQFSGLALSTTYSVQVRVFFNGAWGGYGPICTITTPGSFRPVPSDETPNPIQEEEIQQTQVTFSTVGINSESIEASKNLFEAMVYPNPYQNEFAVNLANYDPQLQITIKVEDAMGRLVEQQVLMPEQLKNITLGQDYDRGMYLVTFKQANRVKSIKIVKL